MNSDSLNQLAGELRELRDRQRQELLGTEAALHSIEALITPGKARHSRHTQAERVVEVLTEINGTALSPTEIADLAGVPHRGIGTLLFTLKQSGKIKHNGRGNGYCITRIDGAGIARIDGAAGNAA